MAEAIRMPLLSDTMKEGVIADWLKKVGDTVKSDDIIAEVETDKATMEVMPYVDGTILYIGVEKGKGVPVNGIMAIIGKPGEDYQAILNAENGIVAAPAPMPETAVATAVDVTPVEVAVVEPEPVITESDERIKASPLAKRLAEEKGVNLHALKGSGDNGRIVKRDIDSFNPATSAAPAAPVSTPAPQPVSQVVPTPQPAPAPKAPQATTPVVIGQEGYTDTPLTQMRKIIAQRLAESKFSAPHFYLRMTITMDKAIEARKAINEVAGTKVSFNDLVIKACAMALRKHPAVNSSWMGEFIRQNHHIHIGTAVAVDEGLIVPVVKFADQKSLSEYPEPEVHPPRANTYFEHSPVRDIQDQRGWQ